MGRVVDCVKHLNLFVSMSLVVMVEDINFEKSA